MLNVGCSPSTKAPPEVHGGVFVVGGGGVMSPCLAALDNTTLGG